MRTVFVVDSSVPEADGDGGLNDDDRVSNIVTVAAEAPQGDPGDPGDDIMDSDDDTIDILVDINLSIVKTFDPASVPQGTLQSFTIGVSNAGPSASPTTDVAAVTPNTNPKGTTPTSSGDTPADPAASQ